MTDYFHRVAALTPTRMWINNITLRQAHLALEAGAVGSTQNPAFLAKVLASEDGEWLLQAADDIVRSEGDDAAAVSELQRQAIARLCEAFHPLYVSSGGRFGFVSIQADPFREHRADILDNAERALRLAENFIIKVPVTKDGLEAIFDLAADGVQVLATEVMSLDQVQDVVLVYETATAGRRFPAPLVIAHINGIFDEYLAETAAAQGADVQPDALGQASLMLGRKICDYLRAAGNPHISYMAGGARGLHHFTDWVGAPGAVTINWGGTADKLLELNPPVTEVFRAPSSPLLVDELLAKMPDFHRAWTPGSLAREDYEAFGPVVKFRRQFEAGWQDAIGAVRGRRR